MRNFDWDIVSFNGCGTCGTPLEYNLTEEGFICAWCECGVAYEQSGRNAATRAWNPQGEEIA